ncbi:MAG: Ig-like domain-containing protein [Planctomycetes bacterium]|nr:Ig-like domain-containing protein [Planctomycetota bacterium]
MTVLASGLLLAGCSGGGGSGGSTLFQPSPSELGIAPATLAVLATAPADGESGVAVDVHPTVLFDGVPIDASLAFAALRRAGDDADLPGTWSVSAADHSATFAPRDPLLPDATYELCVLPLVCATDGRLVEHKIVARFMTVDTRAPGLASSSVPSGGELAPNGTVELRFDEPLQDGGAPRGSFVDELARAWPATVRVTDVVASVRPIADLPGGQRLTLRVEGIADRAGNTAAPLELPLRIPADQRAPHLVASWPGAGGIVAMSPLAWLRLEFDESIDVDALDAGAIDLFDHLGGRLPVDVHASADRRTLWLAPRTPLPADNTCSLALPTGAGGVRDLAGNPLDIDAMLGFRVGADTRAPQLGFAAPADGAQDVPPDTAIELSFDEPIDPGSASGVVLLDADQREVALATRLVVGLDRIRLVPAAPLQPLAHYSVRVRGGADAVRDVAGNPLAAAAAVSFRTGPQLEEMAPWTWPPTGAADVPTDAVLVLHAAEPWNLTTLDAETVTLTDATDAPVAFALNADHGDRVLRLSPLASLAPGGGYELRIAGGPGGARAASGAALRDDLVLRFRTGAGADSIAPTVRLTLDAIDSRRSESLGVAPHGFVVTVEADDDRGGGIDWSTLKLDFAGPGEPPPDADLFALAAPTPHTCRVQLPYAQSLAIGNWTVRAIVADVAGNVGASATLSFEVLSPDLARLPFDRAQVVWLRFDVDRDATGTADFEEDLLRLGLCSAGDPAGTNDTMLRLLRRGVVRRAHELYHRGRDGERLAEGGSVPVLFTDSEPYGATTMSVACGGFDPLGEPGRAFGDASSGVLGRAFYDRANGRPTQDAMSTAPGLGVFPSEMFLFETSIHISVYPSFVTAFARRFMPLCPALGGVAVGRDPLDAIVLAPGFVPLQATSAQRARYETILRAADDWATVVGTIVAHEVGHAVGLVAPGHDATGLHGDETLHNEYASITDVMAAALGYDSIVSLDFQFRDLNVAYLRQRVLLK